MKIAILWTRLSGYLNSSMKALASVPGVEIYVANEAPDKTAPYANSIFDWIPLRYEYMDTLAPDEARLLRELEAFHPDVILASWHVKAFQNCCLKLKSRAVGVACADNQWTGNLRQQVASATSSMHLRKFYDAVFVPGERQAVWARHMGFDESRIWRGTFAPDIEGFTSAGRERKPEQTGFVFAGRLAPEKGLSTLAAAYEGYAAAAAAAGFQSWKCVIAGTGPLAGMLKHQGFVNLGFVQPEALPKLFAEAACFIMPSVIEPWGVALEEAAAAGLPIICTQECGAAVHLLQDNYNGFLIDAGSVPQLEAAMVRMTCLSPERRQQMGDAGRMLALQFTPERWATTILEKGQALQRRLGRA